MAKFGEAERQIGAILCVGKTFMLDGELFTIIESGKPTCRKGEPKTDIYVAAKAVSGKIIELKISYKKENADFIENKTSADRAKALFGDNWSDIIRKATESISNIFEGKKLIYKAGAGRTKKGAITLGWKYELLNKNGGELSGVVPLTREQIIDVYAGTHTSEDKRNANVNGKRIDNSGVANYILMNDEVDTAQAVVDNLCSIEKYVDIHPVVYFACKALNYRTFERKYDGNRPLSVYVDWYIKDGKLCHKLVFNNPLNVGGDEVAVKLLDTLGKLGVETTNDIDNSMVDDRSIIN